MKATLSESALCHVLSVENSCKRNGDCMNISVLVEVINLYYDTHLSGDDKPRFVSLFRRLYLVLDRKRVKLMVQITHSCLDPVIRNQADSVKYIKRRVERR